MSPHDLESLPGDVQALLKQVTEPEPPAGTMDALFARVSQTLGWNPPGGEGGSSGGEGGGGPAPDGGAPGSPGPGDGGSQLGASGDSVGDGGLVDAMGASAVAGSTASGAGALAVGVGASGGAGGVTSGVVTSTLAGKAAGVALSGAATTGVKLAGASLLGKLGIPALVVATGLGAAGGVALQARYEVVPPISQVRPRPGSASESASKAGPTVSTDAPLPLQPEALVEAPSEPPLHPMPEPRPRTALRRHPSSAVPTPPPAPAPESPASPDVQLTAERSLLEVGRTALIRGDSRTALAQAEAHARQYPRGRLSEERETLRIRALVQAGRHAEARKYAEEFRLKYPESILRPAVEAALSRIP